MAVPPSNERSICNAVYSTLQAIAHAEVLGKENAIRAGVTNGAVAQKIILHGRNLRKQHTQFLHVAPSFTLGAMSDGTFEAVIGLVGHNSNGNISAPQQLYLDFKNGRAVIVNDRPDEEW